MAADSDLCAEVRRRGVGKGHWSSFVPRSLFGPAHGVIATAMTGRFSSTGSRLPGRSVVDRASQRV